MESIGSYHSYTNYVILVGGLAIFGVGACGGSGESGSGGTVGGQGFDEDFDEDVCASHCEEDDPEPTDSDSDGQSSCETDCEPNEVCRSRDRTAPLRCTAAATLTTCGNPPTYLEVDSVTAFAVETLHVALGQAGPCLLVVGSEDTQLGRMEIGNVNEAGLTLTGAVSTSGASRVGTVGDLDRDGNDDLVFNRPLVAVAYGDAEGGFAPTTVVEPEGFTTCRNNALLNWGQGWRQDIACFAGGNGVLFEADNSWQITSLGTMLFAQSFATADATGNGLRELIVGADTVEALNASTRGEDSTTLVGPVVTDTSGGWNVQPFGSVSLPNAIIGWRRIDDQMLVETVNATGASSYLLPREDVEGLNRVVSLLDINGDGLLDVTAATPTGLVAYPSSLVERVPGLVCRAEIELGFEPSLAAVATADFNGDGRQELIVADGDVLRRFENAVASWREIVPALDGVDCDPWCPGAQLRA